jgi:hypothetical protein
VERSTIILALGFAFIGAAITAGSCTFPEIAVMGETSGSGASASTGSPSAVSSTSGMGGHTASSGTIGTGGASSSATSSTTLSSTTTSSSSSSGAVKCPLDDDHDMVLSWKCDGGTDCADEDNLAHPNAGFQSSMIKGELQHPALPFDFDCDGVEEQETKVLTCSGLVCTDTTTVGFGSVVPCGQMGQLGKCGGAAPCVFVAGTSQGVQRCK